MATVTSPIILDTTGQSIVGKLEDIKDAIEASGGGGSGIIAPKEESSISAHPYAVGEQFIYNGKLYTATSTISVDDTITPNTNCAESDSIVNQIGIEIAGVAKIIGDTSVTFSHSAITTNSELHLIADNSGTPIFYTGVTVSTGSATYTFPALTEATMFSLKILN